MTKKQVPKQRKSIIEQALLISERVQLEDVRLIDCHCHQEPIAAEGKKTAHIKHSTQVHANKNTGYVAVIPKFQLQAFTESQSSKPIISIDASFLLTYKLKDFDGLTKKGFVAFGDMNGVYNAWPYWREFVQNTIARMGLPTLTIPVFRIASSKESPSASK